MAAIAGLTALGLIAYAFAGPHRWSGSQRFRRASDVVLVLLVLASSFCFLYGARGIAQRTYIKAHDAFH
jgi:hypothetical protein